MKKILFGTLVIAASLSAHAQPANNTGSLDISGSYSCQGTTPDNKPYQDVQLMIKKTDQTFQFQWENKKYGKFKGTGFPLDNSVVTYFSLVRSPIHTGVISYTPTTDGGLQGIFTFHNATKIGNETCTKNKT